MKTIHASHGIVCRKPNERLGYFGWPTVARFEDGRLAVVSSGLRSRHVCPYGKTVLNTSSDEGRTWSAPRVIQDSPIDDRDGGILALGGKDILVSWFRSLAARDRERSARKRFGAEEVGRWAETLAGWTEERVAPYIGSWIMLSENAGASWGKPIRVPVTAPHGPIRLRDGTLFYLGMDYTSWPQMTSHDWRATAARGRDGGRTWETLGTVPIYPGTDPAQYCEPHAVELPSGRILGMLRVQKRPDLPWPAGVPNFSLMQTESDDGGMTWSVPQPLGFHGAPAHLLRHSSGVLILSYGYRRKPYGQRIAFSRTDGATWEHHWILRADGPSWDLGYPSTVELADGSLYTVYYQQANPGEKCSLLGSRWALPTRFRAG